MKNMLTIAAIATTLIAALALILFVLRSGMEERGHIPPTHEVQFELDEHDFGIIKQSDGLVQQAFPFVYNGSIERTIVAVTGSCACTSGSTASSTLVPGETGLLTVTFDPNLHAEPPGRFYKTVSLLTEPPLEEMAEVRIWAEIDLDLGPEFFKLSEGSDEHEDSHNDQGYAWMHADELKRRMSDKDFFLLDVHIPEQEHIEGTDAFIPYTDIRENISELPAEKDAEIIVYCRSGSMSQVAAKALLDLGYSNVSHLEGGINAYRNQ